MISVSHRVGRLAEIRLTSPVVVDDFTVMQRDMAALGSKSHAKLVVCADLSRASVFPEPLADRIGRFFRSDHQRLDRVAIVVGDAATFYLQVDRLLRYVSATQVSARDFGLHSAPKRGIDPSLKRLATRRAFKHPSEAISWLEDALSPEERARLRTFFDESPKSTH
ncbi:MAG: hypothetical protein IPK82_17265 [Polyangiaceae bacterium]|nr:hypothetical protein [Polyangiaceae bacterium]